MVLLTEQAHQELVGTTQTLTLENARLKAENQWLKEQFRLARHRRFGASSEKAEPAGQESLIFNEAEVGADPALPEPSVEVVTHNRRKSSGHREAQLADLPVEEIEHRLEGDAQVCPQCSGALHEMGTEVRDEIKIVPARIVRIKHVRYKYACRRCQSEETTTPIICAPMPKPAFPGSIASASAAAHIMTQKFVMGVPLYRQERQFERSGIDLSRQTMANWMIKGAAWLDHIYDRLHEELLIRPVIHADETTLQVLKEPGRDAKRESFMWLYRTGRDEPAIVLFEYRPTRAAQHPKDFLKGFKGYLNVDGYAGYDPLSADMTLVGCMAHARRKFDEALKVLTLTARKSATTAPLAQVGMQFVGELYKIESDLKDAAVGERYAARLERSKPVLDSFKLWLDAQAPAVLPKSALGGAIGYCRSQWAKLTRFLNDGRLEIDNNRAERSIKPFVIGRKNWLFANTTKGADASAVIYSLVETAKDNGLDPFAYLNHLLETLPNTNRDDPNAIGDLLPWSPSVQNICRVPKRK